MEKMAVKWTIIQMIVIAIASSFVNFRFALGIVLGGIFSLIHFFVLSKNVSSILNNEITSTAKVGSLLIRMLILAFPLMISYKYGEIFNIYGVFFGLMLHKISIIASTIFVEISNNNDKIY